MLSQFPTDDNNQEKVGKTEREEKEGEEGREINDQNRGRGGEGKLWNKRERRWRGYSSMRGRHGCVIRLCRSMPA